VILECLNEKSRDDPYIKNELISIEETVKEMNKGTYIGAALHDKPSWRLGQVENGAEDNYGKDNLES
jgi:hypothetical protein